ncbi:hypothetical protein E2C01_001634 [Portunus trituberculatus]|uniref:Uncharacterized protein n=1 Tax=Portunus trituberculatus TaxID=210409 RepID=A0A5B7CH59_PORTR|nr:hypothetical protein [Portunus trituberculatus]
MLRRQKRQDVTTLLTGTSRRRGTRRDTNLPIMLSSGTSTARARLKPDLNLGKKDFRDHALLRSTIYRSGKLPRPSAPHPNLLHQNLRLPCLVLHVRPDRASQS